MIQEMVLQNKLHIAKIQIIAFIIANDLNGAEQIASLPKYRLILLSFVAKQQWHEVSNEVQLRFSETVLTY